MGSIRNMKELKAEQQRLSRRQKELEEKMDNEWKGLVQGLRPWFIFRKEAVSLIYRILKHYFPLKKL